MEFAVTLFRNDGKRRAGDARFCAVNDDEDLDSLCKSFAHRLYGDHKEGISLFTLRGIPIDERRWLSPGMDVVVAINSEGFLNQAKAIEEESINTEDGPREVVVSFSMNNVKEVDVLKGTVEVDFQMYVSWIDPTLVNVPVADRPPYDEAERTAGDDRPCCWNPKIEVNNNVSLEQLWSLYPAFAQDIATGKVQWGIRYRGSISNDIDLHMFPLESDYFCIKVGPKNDNKEKVRLVVDQNKHGGPDKPGNLIKSSNLQEWTLDVPECHVGDSKPSGSGAIYSNAEFGVMIHRNFMYYVWKVVFIILLLVISSWSVFAQSVDEFADRMATLLTLFLAAVAFLYVVGEALPKISYLTLLDKLLLLAFFFIFMAGFESCFAYIISKTYQDVAAEIDYYSSIGIPAAYISLNLWLIAGGFRHRMRIMDKQSALYEKSMSAESNMKAEDQKDARSSTTNPMLKSSSVETVALGSGGGPNDNSTTLIETLTGLSEEAKRQQQLVEDEEEE